MYNPWHCLYASLDVFRVLCGGKGMVLLTTELDNLL
nr:DUF3265 domain-containing protein [Vibrio neptunius]